MNHIDTPPAVIVYHDEGVSHYASIEEYMKTITRPIQTKVCVIQTPPKSDNTETPTASTSTSTNDSTQTAQ
jgi:hypothetical protein